MPEIEQRIEFAVPSPRKLFTPAVTAVLILMVVGFAFVSYLTDFTLGWLLLSLEGLKHGRIWQLVTYPFFDCCAWTLIPEALVVLFMGSVIEREWRTGTFVALWLIVSVVCGLVWVAISALFGKNYVGLAATSCTFGLVGAFGTFFGGTRYLIWFWVAQAQYLAWGIIAIGIVWGIPQPLTWIWVSGALVGYLYAKLRLRTRWVGASPAVQERPRGFVDID